MSKKYETAAIYKINQSPLLIKCLVVLHCLSVFAIFLSSLVLGYKALLWSAVFFSLLFYLSKELGFDGLLIRHSLLKGWELADLDGIYCPIEVLPSTVISPYLLVMHFNLEKSVGSRFLAQAIDSTALQKNTRLTKWVRLRFFQSTVKPIACTINPRPTDLSRFNQKNKQKQSILICKDALINDDYRKLMVALKITGLKKGET